MKIINQIIFYGKLIEKYGLISSHSGNISAKIGSNILITKTGTMLGSLTPKDITVISLHDPDDKNLKFASMESVVHKSIYMNSNAKAVIHTHPDYLITISYKLKKFKPIDSEGKFLIKELPIIKTEKTIASQEVAEKIGEIASKYFAAIVATHGLFVWTETLEKAFYITTALEKSAKIYYLVENEKK